MKRKHFIKTSLLGIVGLSCLPIFKPEIQEPKEPIQKYWIPFKNGVIEVPDLSSDKSAGMRLFRDGIRIAANPNKVTIDDKYKVDEFPEPKEKKYYTFSYE